jgi:hypothetical protein
LLQPHFLGSCSIEASYAGGIDGREVIDSFLPQIPIFLSEKGVCYLVLVRENKPKEIQQILSSQYHLNSMVIFFQFHFFLILSPLVLDSSSEKSEERRTDDHENIPMRRTAEAQSVTPDICYTASVIYIVT